MKAAILVLALLATNTGLAAQHRCAADARAQARKLIAFHTGSDRNVGVDEAVVELPSIPDPAARRQRCDVPGGRGYPCKTSHRIRLLYARGPGRCVLMGQQVLEHAKL